MRISRQMEKILLTLLKVETHPTIAPESITKAIPDSYPHGLDVKHIDSFINAEMLPSGNTNRGSRTKSIHRSIKRLEDWGLVTILPFHPKKSSAYIYVLTYAGRLEGRRIQAGIRDYIREYKKYT